MSCQTGQGQNWLTVKCIGWAVGTETSETGTFFYCETGNYTHSNAWENFLAFLRYLWYDTLVWENQTDCRCGGIGRRTWLKIKRVTPCRFESGQRHLIKRERIFHFRNVRSLFRWFCTETVSILTTAAILLLQQWLPLFSEAYFFMTVFLPNTKLDFSSCPHLFPFRFPGQSPSSAKRKSVSPEQKVPPF